MPDNEQQQQEIEVGVEIVDGSARLTVPLAAFDAFVAVATAAAQASAARIAAETAEQTAKDQRDAMLGAGLTAVLAAVQRARAPQGGG